MLPNMACLAVLLLISAQLASAYVDLGSECPGNLLQNGGFEEPNTEQVPTHMLQQSSNSKWGWYESIPGEYSLGTHLQGHITWVGLQGSLSLCSCSSLMLWHCCCINHS